MDLTIQIGSALNPQEKTVEKDKTPRELLTEMNIAFNDGQVQHNGSVLGSGDLNSTLEELEVEDDDSITVVSKQNSGKSALRK